MPWHDITLVESVWSLQAAAAKPTNPSSFVLAVVGVVTYLCYHIIARPGYERRRPLDASETLAKPQTAGVEAAAATEERRVA